MGEDQVAVLPTEMQSLLLLLLSSTKVKVTLTNDPESEEDPGIPSVKYHLQLGDLTVKTELSTTNNNSLLETKVSDSDEKGIFKEEANLQRGKMRTRDLRSWRDGGR